MVSFLFSCACTVRRCSHSEPPSASRRSAITPPSMPSGKAEVSCQDSFERISSEPAEQLGIEVGGLLRHYLTGKGDIAHLFEVHRIHEECHIGIACAHFRGGLLRAAQIADI